MDLSHFFSATEARTNRWRQMNATGRAWKAVVLQGQHDEKIYDELVRLYEEIKPLEEYWAFP